MIQLSPRGKVIYQFLSLTVVLLLLYGVGFTSSALSLLPAGQLTPALSAAGADFKARIFQLLCLTGFISAGFMMADDSPSDRELARALRGWQVFVALTAVLSLLGFGPALDGLMALALLFILRWSRRAGADSNFMRLWQAGLLLIALSLPAAHIAPSAMRPALLAFQRHTAFALCALSVVSWLMPRYRARGREKAPANLPMAAPLLLLGGGLISLGHIPLPPLLGLGAGTIILLAHIILASHLARSLRDRNENASLAPHWVALAALCWLTGAGILGALLSQSGLNLALADTDVNAARDWLGDWFIVAAILAFINEAATSLRGDNRRVTGYLPLWLIAFGVGSSFIVQLCRGVAQFTLREFGAASPLSEAEWLLPFTILWLIGSLVAAAGIVIYALGYFARHPAIRVVEP